MPLTDAMSYLDTLIGQKIVFINDNQENAKITFEKIVRLLLILRPENFIGPEAIFLQGPDSLMVVWTGV